jgi:hypothetical protein
LLAAVGAHGVHLVFSRRGATRVPAER